jgi:CubicO group peptidase (beta-lactamase class C family)
MSLSRNFKKPARFAFPQLRIASLLIVFFLAAAANLAAAQESKLSPEKRTQIEAAVSKFMASTHVPGVSVAIVENSEYEWGGGFGLADVEYNSPAS